MFQLPDQFAGGGDDSSSSPTNYAPYLTLLSGGMAAGADFSSGSQTSALMKANAAVAGLQAKSAVQSGAENAEMMRQRLAQTLGKQQAQVGGAGLTRSGSALRSIETTAEFGARDIAQTQLNAARKSWGFSVDQTGDLAKASMDQSASNFQGVGALITTGAKAFGQWSAD